MGRAPCCEKVGLKKGRWTAEEDEILLKYIEANGEGSWRSLPKNAGLLRCGKSCRLRWINYLRTDLKRGNISPEEEDLIIKLHNSMGNKWSVIAGQLPGRTDNEIKNYWNSHLSRRIHTFRRPISSNVNEAPVVVMDLAAKIGNKGGKPKGGRKSRAVMKKNNITPSTVLKMPIDQKTTEKSGCEDDVMTLISTQEKEVQMSAILGQVEERESMILDSCEDGGERDSFVIPGGPCHDGEGILVHSVERESKMLCSSEDIESGLLGSSYVEQRAAGILCSNNNIDDMGNEMMGADGVLTFNEVRENGFMGFGENHHDEEGLAALMMNSNNKSETISNDQGSSSNGVLMSSSSIGEGSDQWYSSTSLTTSSRFGDDWANWDFDLGSVAHQDLKVWDEREDMLTWLWESNDNIEGSDTAKIESEKQNALADWLLS